MSNEALPFPLPDKLAYPHLGNQLTRRFFVTFYKLISPAIIEDYKNSISRTSELVDQGYTLVTLGFHWNKGDGFDFIIRPIDLIAQLYASPAVMPIAFHQYAGDKTRSLLDLLKRAKGFTLHDYLDNKTKGLIQGLANLNAVTLAPVVNSDTMDKELNYVPGTHEQLPMGYGTPQYAHLMDELIKSGGASGIAPQAGRRKSLEIDQAKQRTLEKLLVLIARERRRTDPNLAGVSLESIIRSLKIAVLLMPIRPLYEADYEKEYDRLNFFKKKLVQVGPVFTIDEIYQVRDKANDLLVKRKEDIRQVYEKMKLEDQRTQDPTEITKDHVNLDEAVLTILSFGAEPEYNRISKEEGWAQAVADVIDIVEAVRDSASDLF